MQKWLLLLLLFCCVKSNAQSPRFHIDVVATQFYNLDKGPEINILNIVSLSRLDASNYQSYGLHFLYKVNPKVEIGTGLNYAAIDVFGFISCDICFFIPHTGDLIIGPGIFKSETLHQFQIPLLVNFFPFSEAKRIAPYFSGAFIPSLVAKPPTGADASGVHVNYQLGSGLRWRIADWLQWSVEASLAYQSLGLQDAETIDRYFGLGSRLGFYFN